MRTLIIAMSVLMVYPPATFGREWTDSTGVYKVEAEYVGIKEGRVRLRKANGTIVSIPIERLSESDRAFALSSARGQESRREENAASGTAEKEPSKKADMRLRAKERLALESLGRARAVQSDVSGSIEDVVAAYSLVNSLANSETKIADWLLQMKYSPHSGRKASRLLAVTAATPDIAHIRRILGRENDQKQEHIDLGKEKADITWYKYQWLEFGVVKGIVRAIRADLTEGRNEP